MNLKRIVNNLLGNSISQNTIERLEKSEEGNLKYRFGWLKRGYGGRLEIGFSNGYTRIYTSDGLIHVKDKVYFPVKPKSF